MGVYRRGILVFGVVSAALGIAIAIRTGTFIGILIGLLFVAVGAGRVYLLYRR
ncbi:MAG: hypothetical protein KGI93_04515 [Acidobacteriota bacterium]|nr:hypothetical protein [Acidobacteriota bacterium]MDE3189869.1 hypothetical protein [Acidobacteriota bacterium]